MMRTELRERQIKMSNYYSRMTPELGAEELVY